MQPRLAVQSFARWLNCIITKWRTSKWCSSTIFHLWWNWRTRHRLVTTWHRRCPRERCVNFRFAMIRSIHTGVIPLHAIACYCETWWNVRSNNATDFSIRHRADEILFGCSYSCGYRVGEAHLLSVMFQFLRRHSMCCPELFWVVLIDAVSWS